MLKKVVVIALQDTHLPLHEIMKDADECARAGIPIVSFGLLDDGVRLSDGASCDAIPFGSVKMIRLWLAGKLPSGWRVFFDPGRFDQANWGPAIGDRALNAGVEALTLSDVIDRVFPTPVFVKPTADLKSFAGRVLPSGSTLREQAVAETSDTVLIAPICDGIVAEYRAFVGPHGLVTASVYREHGETRHRPVTAAELDMLAGYVRTIGYEPAPWYVVDIATTPRGLRVVEFNCINCSGRYSSNRAALFSAISVVL